MCSKTRFPDAIVFPDGTIRFVTQAAKRVTYLSSNLKELIPLRSARDVPDYYSFDDSWPVTLKGRGLEVRQQRQPVGHYRSKRRRWPKARASGNVAVIDFLARVPEAYRNDAMRRRSGRKRKQSHRKETTVRRPRKKAKAAQ